MQVHNVGIIIIYFFCQNNISTNNRDRRHDVVAFATAMRHDRLVDGECPHNNHDSDQNLLHADDLWPSDLFVLPQF